MSFDGIRPEQGPPLAIPASFFVLAPVAVVAAGVFLFAHPAALTSRWLPEAMVLTHLGTLGFLGAIMLGALYQMLPVVASSPVPAPRLGHVVHAAFVLGVAALVHAFGSERVASFQAALVLLAVAFGLFLAQAVTALWRAPSSDDTVNGMRLAIAGLALAVGVALVLARARAGVAFTGDWLVWTGVHLSLGGVVWIGGLLTAVSWQVLPMFYLTEPYPRWLRQAILGAVAATATLVVVVAALGMESRRLLPVVAPAALALWLLHPLVTLRLLARRRRRRVDPSLDFWRAAMLAAMALLVVVGTLLRTGHPHAPVLVGWLAIWGWAGMVAHGMLTRIVPFLVWFHRYSRLVGLEPVPSMRALLPPRHVRVDLALHVATLVAGAVAILVESASLTRVTAVGLVLTGLALAAALGRVLWHLARAAVVQSTRMSPP